MWAAQSLRPDWLPTVYVELRMASGSQADYLLVEAEKPTSTDTLEVCTKKADHKE